MVARLNGGGRTAPRLNADEEVGLPAPTLTSHQQASYHEAQEYLYKTQRLQHRETLTSDKPTITYLYLYQST
jgi:hypothetical protein